MPSLPLGLVSEVHAGPRVHNNGLLDNKTITVEARNVPARVGQRDLIDLVGVEPDLALSAFEH
jgi:hypothetical protein